MPTVSSVILSEVAREKESLRNYDLKADKRDEDTVRFLDLQLIVCGKVNSRQFRGSILKIKKVESSFCVAFHCFIVSRKTVKLKDIGFVPDRCCSRGHRFLDALSTAV